MDSLKINRHKHNIVLFFVLACLLNSGCLFSAVNVADGIPALGGKFYPSLRSEALYNDNVLLQDKNTKESIVIVTTPRLNYEFEGNITQFSVDMGIENGHYTHSHNDNYLDADTQAKMSVYPTERISFFGNAGYKRGHEVRGSGSQSGGFATEFDNPDKFRLWNAEIGLKYGLEEVGTPRVQTSYYHTERRYTNNRRRTRIQDRNTDGLNTTLFYQIMPSTSLLVQGNIMRVAYQQGFAPGDFDSKQYTVLGGLTWDATYQTDGFIKAGWNQRFFDVSSRGESSNFSWEVGVNWAPLTYSSLSLVTSQKLDEADGLGNDANVRNVTLTWRHGWYRSLSTTVNLSYNNADYSGNQREDNDFGAGLSVDYEFRRWLTVGANYSYITRSSTGDSLDYKRNLVGIHMVLSL